MTTDTLRIAVAQLKPTMGDIAGNLDKARAARATASGHGADLVLFTELFLSGYLPEDLVLKPAYQDACRDEGAGIFCLVKTSNPGSGDVQDARLEDGRPLWQHVASLVRELGEGLVGESGLSSVGAVFGATYPAVIEAARRLLPQTPFLLPGVGAQGGAPERLAAAFSAGRASALVSASRSVIYASGGTDWQDAAAAEASRLARQVWRVATA